ncbi:MAG: choice-of-anchor V domain-containing protein [Bryobacteraceae bacterium]
MKTFTLFLIPVFLVAYPSGSRIPAGNSGEPGSGTPCASCHNVTLNPASGSVKLATPDGSTFSPGVAQHWTVTITDSNASYRKGFQLTATGGQFTAASGTIVNTSGGRQYVSQSTSSSTYSFDWTPPDSSGSVSIYLAAAAASGTRQTNVYTTTLALSRAPSAPAPTIQSAGVVNAASFDPAISAGSWVSIFGANLAPAGIARSWTADEIVNGKLPTTLESTQVRINGKAAAIAFVSESQLNVQAPADDALGTVSVEVTTAAGTGQAATVTLRQAAPGLFRFSPDSNRYAAAVSSAGALLGPAGLFGTAVTTRPARPGETILLFGTGFGKTDPEVVPGDAFSGAAPLAAGNNLSIRIGGIDAAVAFAGLSGAGLYQFNVTVPDALPDGDQLIEATVLGVAVPTTQRLNVLR